MIDAHETWVLGAGDVSSRPFRSLDLVCDDPRFHFPGRAPAGTLSIGGTLRLGFMVRPLISGLLLRFFPGFSSQGEVDYFTRFLPSVHTLRARGETSLLDLLSPSPSGVPGANMMVLRRHEFVPLINPWPVIVES